MLEERQGGQTCKRCLSFAVAATVLSCWLGWRDAWCDFTYAEIPAITNRECDERALTIALSSVSGRRSMGRLANSATAGGSRGNEMSAGRSR